MGSRCVYQLTWYLNIGYYRNSFPTQKIECKIQPSPSTKFETLGFCTFGLYVTRVLKK